MRMGGGGGGRGGMGGGGDLTEHRYNLTLSVMFNNLINHYNPGGFVGNLNSPQFGQPTGINSGFGGGPAGAGGGSAEASPTIAASSSKLASLSDSDAGFEIRRDRERVRTARHVTKTPINGWRNRSQMTQPIGH